METRYELLSSSLACMYHDIQKIERMEMAKYNLKGPHAQCLMAMKRHPEGITAVRLCEVCDKDRAAVSRTLTELESAGMICRENHNGSRYRAILTLTQQGMAAADLVTKKVQRAVELAGKGFDDGEREVFYRVMAIIAGNLHQICKTGLDLE